ncbi:hypothetical protein PR048_019277 [Dryococelus australis]|uniref:Uncharacterized protein n=1 Tax=Dryococelus australis TaxID=614101 RepID=A0ABQ9H354_9NEOP|nr:hypothetical protein PR048_019277 [Dryococelus australis]
MNPPDEAVWLRGVLRGIGRREPLGWPRGAVGASPETPEARRGRPKCRGRAENGEEINTPRTGAAKMPALCFATSALPGRAASRSFFRTERQFTLRCHSRRRGRGGSVVRLLASNVGEPGSIPGGAAPGSSRVEIMPDDSAGRRALSVSPSSPSLTFRRCSRCTRPHAPEVPRRYALRDTNPPPTRKNHAKQALSCAEFIRTGWDVLYRKTVSSSASRARQRRRAKNLLLLLLFLLLYHFPSSVTLALATEITRIGDDGKPRQDTRRSNFRISACGNRAGRCCRWSGFPGDLPYLPSLYSGAAPYSGPFAPIGSRDLDVKRRPNLCTQSLCVSAQYLRLVITELQLTRQRSLVWLHTAGLEMKSKITDMDVSIYDLIVTSRPSVVAMNLVSHLQVSHSRCREAGECIHECREAGSGIYWCREAGECIHECREAGSGIYWCREAGGCIHECREAGSGIYWCREAGECIHECREAGSGIYWCREAGECIHECREAGSGIYWCREAGECIHECREAGGGIYWCREAGECIHECREAGSGIYWCREAGLIPGRPYISPIERTLTGLYSPRTVRHLQFICVMLGNDMPAGTADKDAVPLFHRPAVSSWM